jgi:glycine C-acetyltransferase
MYNTAKQTYADELAAIREAGLYKDERIIRSPQTSEITVTFPENSPAREVLNFCANNYLGLANHPRIIEAAKRGLDTHGFGLSSVRFICGTQDIHKELERRIANFYQMDDTILYAACFDANGGLFEPLLGAEDAIITDALNHASIIDGIRLCKAKRLIFEHANMTDLEARLKQARDDGAKRIIVATDGVFSMDGDVANLRDIVALAEQYDAMTMVDECHATGFFGKTGRGALEHNGVLGKVEIVTSTLGKAMGGASGGFTTGKQEIIDLLRQRSRPYLFSNTVAPAVVAGSIEAFDLLEGSDKLREELMTNTQFFRDEMTKYGFDINPGVHPIVPVLFRKFDNDAELSQRMSRDLYDEGIYVVGFYYPVVPKGQARIRVQISAAHSREQINRLVEAFVKVGKKHGVISA